MSDKARCYGQPMVDEMILTPVCAGLRFPTLKHEITIIIAHTIPCNSLFLIILQGLESV